MSLLVVMAHFDARRRLRAHTRRTISAYAATADRVVVVSTSGAADEDLAVLPRNVEFSSRSNFGYDFFSYKWALDLVGDYAAYDRILISNDSFIGPLVPLDEILSGQRAGELDLMGMTWSRRHGGHAQSFFVAVTSRVARSNAFRRFWADMTPVSDRTEVITRYEAGLTRVVASAGFRVGAYFQPTEREEALARARFRHQLSVRVAAGHTTATVNEVARWTPAVLGDYNPAAALADRALDARLPLLKFDTLRFDPYGLGSDSLLTLAEARFPAEMAGVREYLCETHSDYPVRAGEWNLLPDTGYLHTSGLGYGSDAAFDAAAHTLEGATR